MAEKKPKSPAEFKMGKDTHVFSREPQKTEKLAFNQFIANPEMNYRRPNKAGSYLDKEQNGPDGEKVGDLAKDIATHGLIKSLSVMYGDPRDKHATDPKKLYLFDGFRRLEALKKNGADEALVDIWPYMTEFERKAKQASANESGLKPGPQDTSRLLVELRAAGGFEEVEGGKKWNYTQAMLAAVTGISAGHVGNLLSIRDKIDPRIQASWDSERPEGCLTTMNLVSWSKLPHEEQYKTFAVKCGLTPEGQDDGEDGGDDPEKEKKGTSDKPKKMPSAEIPKIFELLRSEAATRNEAFPTKGEIQEAKTKLGATLFTKVALEFERRGANVTLAAVGGLCGVTRLALPMPDGGEIKLWPTCDLQEEEPPKKNQKLF